MGKNTKAIAVIHGIGSQEPGFSIPLQQGIAKHFSALGDETQWHDLIFKEIVWSDILLAQQERLFQRINYNNDLAYVSMRKFFIDYFADAIAYQPTDDESRIAVYERVHDRIDAGLKQLADHPEVDAATTPLYLVGHSLGTVILSSYIWDNQQSPQGDSPLARLQTLQGLVTLGSPLALWALRYKDFGEPIASPGIWLNFYDKDDIIACPLKNLNPAFNEVVTADIPVNVGGILSSWNPAAHTQYWVDKDIHQGIADLLFKS